MPTLQYLFDLGFAHAGRYQGTTFTICDEWLKREVVYAWVDASASEPRLLRFGIACGHSGFGGRYHLYNRWLAGQFKPGSPEEQKKRALFLQRLSSGSEIYALQVPDKLTALSTEATLRRLWGASLDLDLMAKGSWAKAEMAKWRATVTRIDKPKRTQARENTRPMSLGQTHLGSSAVALHQRLEQSLIGLGLTPTPLVSGRGTSYRLGRAAPVRIDPKQAFLRIWVGEDEEARAPTQLRGSYAQKGWLIAFPADANLVEEYVLGCARQRLKGL